MVLIVLLVTYYISLRGVVFPGGSYGLVRVAISPYFGFLVAMSEALDYITFTSFGVSALGKMISYVMIGQEETPYNPLIWLVVYAAFLFSSIRGGNFSLWNFISAMTICAILIKVLFCFAAIPNFNYSEYNDKETVFASAAFVQVLPFCASFFAGIEVSTQLSGYVEKVTDSVVLHATHPFPMVILVMSCFLFVCSQKSRSQKLFWARWPCSACWFS